MHIFFSVRTLSARGFVAFSDTMFSGNTAGGYNRGGSQTTHFPVIMYASYRAADHVPQTYSSVGRIG